VLSFVLKVSAAEILTVLRQHSPVFSTHSFIHIRLLKTEMTERICTSIRNTEEYKNSKNS